MQKNLKDDTVDLFFEAVLSLKNKDECYDFFEDLCTVNEIKSISQRLTVAKMLREKSVYSEIIKFTGASSATVSRVKRSLQYGNGSLDKFFEKKD